MRNSRTSNSTADGHALTAQRRLVLELIRNADGHIDAKEIYRRATGKDESISLATVYRTLHLFKRLGLVDERRLARECSYYEVSQLTEHHHLICQGCGKVIEFESPLISELVSKAQREHSFEVTKAELYLRGYCQHCQKGVKPK